jgi:uncharacterized protein
MRWPGYQEMKALYFGTRPRELFGIYHPPDEGAKRRMGVVLCYPAGPEYQWAHRAFCQLAKRLRRVGFPVFRFDYFGCGDSAGNDTDGNFDQWKADVVTAIEKIKELSKADKVALVGLRLGATLCYYAATRRPDVENLILWEPILKGEQHIRELLQLHQDWLGRGDQSATGYRDQSPAGEALEILGYPLTVQNMRAIETINLCDAGQVSCRNCLLVRNIPSAEDELFIKQFQALKGRLEVECIDAEKVWTNFDGEGRVTVPEPVLERVIRWLSQVAP